jgi:hypothetical protein
MNASLLIRLMPKVWPNLKILITPGLLILKLFSNYPITIKEQQQLLVPLPPIKMPY